MNVTGIVTFFGPSLKHFVKPISGWQYVGWGD